MNSVIGGRIAGLVHEHSVVLFMKGSRGNPACGFSAKAVEVLDSLLPEYTTVDVLRDPEVRDAVKQYSNWPTIPQLFIRGEFVGGSDIIIALLESGELQEKLGELAKPLEIKISLTPAAVKELKQALEEPGEAVRLEVSPNFEYDLTVGVPDPRDVRVSASGIDIAISRSSAARASGMQIDVVQTAEGPAFKIMNPNEPAKVQRISAGALAERLKSEPDLLIVDVREPDEVEIATLPGARLLDQALIDELSNGPADRPMVVFCHHGNRSQRAAEQLVREGFREVYNLVGGINAWSMDVDPDVARY